MKRMNSAKEKKNFLILSGYLVHQSFFIKGIFCYRVFGMVGVVSLWPFMLAIIFYWFSRGINFDKGLQLNELWIFKKDKSNLLLFIVLVLSSPQVIVWQANFSPTIYFLILLLFNLELGKQIIKIRTLYISCIYFSLYIILSITRKILII